MPWQTKENKYRRNSSRQTIVLCSAYRNTWLPSVKGATYVTSIVLVFCFSNGHSVCHNCWAVRKSRHLLPLTTRGKIRDDLHRLGLELNWTCGQNRKQIIQTAFSQNHQILNQPSPSIKHQAIDLKFTIYSSNSLAKQIRRGRQRKTMMNLRNIRFPTYISVKKVCKNALNSKSLAPL